MRNQGALKVETTRKAREERIVKIKIKKRKRKKKRTAEEVFSLKFY